MTKNKKVPLNCSSEGTSKLLMIGVKNKNAISLYTKKAFNSSHGLKYCIPYRTPRSSKWLEVE